MRLFFAAIILPTVLTFAYPGITHAQNYYSVQELLVTGKTVVGEDIRYPTTGKPRITVSIVTVESGAPASMHRHPAPLVAYILEGELTVDYGPYGKKTLKAGDAIVEAMDVSHRGINQSDRPVKILGVYIGAEGTPNVAIDR